jgi:hypothetical protein
MSEKQDEETNNPNVLVVEKQKSNGKGKVLILGAAGVALLAAVGAMQRSTNVIAENTSPTAPEQADFDSLRTDIQSLKTVLDRLAWEVYIEGGSPNTGSLAEALTVSTFMSDSKRDDIVTATESSATLLNSINNYLSDIKTLLTTANGLQQDIIDEVVTNRTAFTGVQTQLATLQIAICDSGTPTDLKDLKDVLDQIETNTSP